MVQDLNVKSSRVPRWIKVALGLSLAANLAVAGMIAGAALRGGPKGPMSSAGGYARAYIRALPREDRNAIFEQMHAERGEHRASHAERRALYDTVLVALRAPELDRAAIIAALEQQKAASIQMQNSVQDQWIALVSRMSMAERIAYADAIQEVLDRKRGGHQGRKP